MKQVSGVEFKPGSKEELLPDFDADFPYICTCSGLRDGNTVPWHWHTAVELFYVESGCLEYSTPSMQHRFPAGSGGLINTNVPHTARGSQTLFPVRQLLHLFDPMLIAGHHESLIEEKYVLPLTAAPQAELIALHPEDPIQAEILELLRRSYEIPSNAPGYELRIRAVLSDIWLRLLDAAAPQLAKKQRSSPASDQIKTILVHIHEHYAERLTVQELAKAVSISPRSCFNLFKTYLHTTPMEYVTSYRLRTACRMLVQTSESVTAISSACGLGSSSYFGKLFREKMGCTPLEYRGRHKNSP